MLIALWVKISTEDNLNFFLLIFSRNFFLSFSLETICLKSQSLFSMENKKSIIKLLSAEDAHRVEKVNRGVH